MTIKATAIDTAVGTAVAIAVAVAELIMFHFFMFHFLCLMPGVLFSFWFGRNELRAMIASNDSMLFMTTGNK